MAGLPRAVVFAIGLLLLHFVTGTNAFECKVPPVPEMVGKPQRCFTNLITTQNNMDNEERQNLVNAMNLYRGFITNQCKFKSGKANPTRFTKIRYNCALEEKVKFTCSEAVKWDFDAKDGKIVRMKHKVEKLNNKYKSAIWRELPPLNSIEFGLRMTIDDDFMYYQFFRFMLNDNAEEAACYSQKCGDIFYLACTADQPFSMYRPVYDAKPQYLGVERCRNDKDCVVGVGGQTCDQDDGLCENLKCTVNSNDVVDNLCAYVRSCVTDFCKALVLIVQKNDNGYEVVGVGTAVGPEYILSSVSSNFIKHSREDLFVVVEGSKLYPFYKADGTDSAYAETHIGHFNLTQWQDLVLIKLGASAVKFTNFMALNGQKALPDKMQTLVTLDKYFIVVEQNLASPADCEKMFQKDVFKYSEDYNMACAKDSEDFVTSFLSGAPMAVQEDGKFILYGLRSLGSIDPASKAGHLITPIKPYCDWFKSVSNGAVRCT